jgi:hypothetical protein
VTKPPRPANPPRSANTTPRAPAPPVAPLSLPTLTPTTSKPTPAPPSSSSSGFKLSGFLKRDRSSSIAGSSKYGNLDVPSAQFDNRSIESRTSDTVDEMGNFGRSSSATATAEKKGKNRQSLLPSFGTGGLFRRGTQSPAVLAGGGGRSPVPSPALERRESAGGLAGARRNTIDSIASSATVPTITTPIDQAPMFGGEASKAEVDSEGYSVPPAGYDKEPWQSSAPGTNLMDDDDEEGEEA